MIRLTDAGLLALTKVRARKLRTCITVCMASMLFGVLIVASLVTNGLFAGVKLFRSEGLTSRYIVNISNAPSDSNSLYSALRSPQLIAEAKRRYAALVTQKTAEAKRLGVQYSQINDQPPYSKADDGTEQLLFSDPNDIVHQLLKEKYQAVPAFDEAKLARLAKQYNAVATYSDEIYNIRKGSSLSPLSNGKEIFYDTSDEAEVSVHQAPPAFDGTSIVLSPPEITGSFLLPDNAGWQPDGSSLPVILPQHVVERLLHLEKLPASARPSEKLERLKIIRDKVSSLSFEMCYRNSASQSLIQQTLQQKKERIAHQSNSAYQKPSVIYALPDPARCAHPTIVSDTRTAEEKTQAANQELFDAKFGKETKPISKMIRFKVVGVSPGGSETSGPGHEQRDKSRTVDDMVAEMLSTEGIGQVVPRHLYDQLPNKADYADLLTYEPLYLTGSEDNKSRLIEFANADDAQRFIDEQSCTVQYDNTCTPAGRPYQAVLGFSNSVALDDAHRMLNQWSLYSMLGVMVLAALIMWITISRTIADGRHETAVFRAIGFKRIDIVLVYVLYAVMLSLMVAAVAAGTGFAGAYVLDNQFALQLTAQAQYGFGAINSPHTIHLVEVNGKQIVAILAACFMTGLLSVVPPLMRHVRRNPIRDMRERE